MTETQVLFRCKLRVRTALDIEGPSSPVKSGTLPLHAAFLHSCCEPMYCQVQLQVLEVSEDVLLHTLTPYEVEHHP